MKRNFSIQPPSISRLLFGMCVLFILWKCDDVSLIFVHKLRFSYISLFSVFFRSSFWAIDITNDANIYEMCNSTSSTGWVVYCARVNTFQIFTNEKLFPSYLSHYLIRLRLQEQKKKKKGEKKTFRQSCRHLVKQNFYLPILTRFCIWICMTLFKKNSKNQNYVGIKHFPYHLFK